jgi:hypothetical protein
MREKSLTHRVVMAEPVLERAPVYVRQEARIRLEQLVEGLKQIPADSVFWASARASRLCLVVHGWSFYYTLERGTLRVTEVRSGYSAS